MEHAGRMRAGRDLGNRKMYYVSILSGRSVRLVPFGGLGGIGEWLGVWSLLTLPHQRVPCPDVLCDGRRSGGRIVSRPHTIPIDSTLKSICSKGCRSQITAVYSAVQ